MGCLNKDQIVIVNDLKMPYIPWFTVDYGTQIFRETGMLDFANKTFFSTNKGLEDVHSLLL